MCHNYGKAIEDQQGMDGSSNFPGERLYVDLIKDESFGGAKFWALIVDDCTDYCWSYVAKSMDQLKTKVVELVEELKC
jgi:hypothetical protein